MKLPAFVERLFRTKAYVGAMTAAENPGLVGNGGWMNLIRESFTGAWQSGVVIDGPRDILSFSGVFAPLTLIASDIAKLRIKLVEEDADGVCTEVLRNSPFLGVLKRPNHFQSRIQFVEQWILSKLLYGNTYVLKVREGRDMVRQLYILDAQRVKALVTPEGDVYYQLSADPLSGLYGQVTVPASEIIHDRWNCLWHPLVGVSPLYAAAMSATMGRKIQGNSGKFFENMSRPSGMLTAPGTISQETASRLKTEWEQNYGGANIGRTAVLGDGLKYESMTIPADQSQMLQQLEWSARDTAAAFHMPLFKVGGPIPIGSTVQALNLMYYSDCLQCLIESAELCLDEGVAIKDGYYHEFDVDNLLRMDTSAQIAMLAEGVKGAILAPNEARARFNLKPVAGGGSPYLQMQNFSLEALSKRDALPNPFIIDRPTANPTPSADGPPAVADPSTEPKKSVDDQECTGVVLEFMVEKTLREYLEAA